MAMLRWVIFNVVIGVIALITAGFAMWLLEQQGWINP
jgi:hypothetical protein